MNTKIPIIIFITTILAVLGLNRPVSAVEIIDVNCSDLELVWLRGSGQPLNHADFKKIQSEVNSQFSLNKIFTTKNFHELNYPAVEITTSRALGASISGGNAFAYGNSVAAGVKNLKNHIKTVSETCKNTKFILAGYSQGAQVIMDSLKDLNSNQILYIALLGEPKLYLPEGSGLFAPACKGKNFSPYRVFAPNCYTYKGSLGKRDPYYADSKWDGKVGLWCNSHDFICGSSKKLSDNDGHVSYNKNGQILDVARKIRDHVLDEFPVPDRTTKIEHQVAMDTVIMIDTTYSMDQHINDYRAKARTLAEQTFAYGGRVALIEYQDFRDAVPNRIICDFHCTEEEFYRAINRIYAVYGTGGGDTDEDLLGSLMLAYNNLDWRPGANKSIIVLTDAGYHSPDRSGVTYREAVTRSLEIDPVNTYIIAHTSVYAESRQNLEKLANDTGGAFFLSSDFATGADLAHNFVTSRPVALLALEEYFAQPGQDIFFDARDSYALNGLDISSFEFDFNGDGVYDFTSPDGTALHEYPSDFNGFVVVKVTDSTGTFATMSAKVKVSATPPAEISLPAPNVTEVIKTSEDTIKITFVAEDAVKYIMASINGVQIGYIDAGLEELMLADLDFSDDLEISLTSMSADLELGESTTFLVSPQGEIKYATETETPEPPTDTPKQTENLEVIGNTEENLRNFFQEPFPPAKSSMYIPDDADRFVQRTVLPDVQRMTLKTETGGSRKNVSKFSAEKETKIPEAGESFKYLWLLPATAFILVVTFYIKLKLRKISHPKIDQND